MENRGREPRVKKQATLYLSQGERMEGGGDKGYGEERTDFRSLFGGGIS